MPSIYVTGTDTGVGKTEASVALLHGLRARGLRAVGMKPVASGCEWIDGAWRNEDARALREASDPLPPEALCNPYALPEPTAPEIAAALAGVEVDLARLCRAYAALTGIGDAVVVEGVGGWAAPLARELEQSALVHALDLPVVLVVGLRLGCISHARLTARAVQADGCRLLGWIGNRIDPGLAHPEATIAILQRLLPAPCLGLLPRRRAGQPIDGHRIDLAVLARLAAGPDDDRPRLTPG